MCMCNRSGVANPYAMQKTNETNVVVASAHETTLIFNIVFS
jgi:hypothetical protein